MLPKPLNHRIAAWDVNGGLPARTDFGARMSLDHAMNANGSRRRIPREGIASQQGATCKVVSTLPGGEESNRVSVPIFRGRWRFEGELLLVREDRSGRASGVPVVMPMALPGSYARTG